MCIRDSIKATWDALVLGTRDYVRKCGFSKALIGLSGGIDSALVAAIAVEALGAENVTGIGMPSEYSSEGSKAVSYTHLDVYKRQEHRPLHDRGRSCLRRGMLVDGNTRLLAAGCRFGPAAR